MKQKRACVLLDEDANFSLERLMKLRCTKSKSQIIREALMFMHGFYFKEKVSCVIQNEKNNVDSQSIGRA